MAEEGSKIVTGTLVESNEGWLERASDLCDPENFEVSIRPTPKLFSQLTGTELTRMEPKLKIVSRMTKMMAAGMLKGTIKYPRDDYSQETWKKHLLGEGADYINYIGLTIGEDL